VFRESNVNLVGGVKSMEIHLDASIGQCSGRCTEMDDQCQGFVFQPTFDEEGDGQGTKEKGKCQLVTFQDLESISFTSAPFYSRFFVKHTVSYQGWYRNRLVDYFRSHTLETTHLFVL
jgi:hypothetical protein